MNYPLLGISEFELSIAKALVHGHKAQNSKELTRHLAKDNPDLRLAAVEDALNNIYITGLATRDAKGRYKASWAAVIDLG